MESENSIAMVLANHEFRDEEYLDTMEALRSAGISVKIVAAINEDCIGTGGTEVGVDFTPDEIDSSQFEGIVFIGGVGIEGYLHDSDIHALAKGFYEAGKPVGAICWAPAILANAGVLQGKQATSWSGAQNDLIKGGATYTGTDVTIDGNIITANGPDAAMKFGRILAKVITS